MHNDGVLYIVATPIGNLEDLSPRARSTLEQVDLIAAEDTRRTARLLSHFGIKTRQFALHEHNEQERVPALMEALLEGRCVALVSDAGTPLISDPGYRLLQAAHDKGLRVVPVPGPSAVVAALSASGLPTDRLLFESVHRVQACLRDIAAELGASRDAFIGRELSKLHEQCVRKPVAELCAMIEDGSIAMKGEFVLVIAGADEASVEESGLDVGQLLHELSQVVAGKQAVAIAGRLTGRPRNELYRLMLDARGGGDD
jgi:16S rRNA (cytidine1402-2'-O)-methyltransferase